jgi:hypothetical protein
MFLEVATSTGDYVTGEKHIAMEVPLNPYDDASSAPRMGLPDCDSPTIMDRLKQRERTWCFSPVPTDAQRSTIDAALARMRAKGGPCIALADAAANLLSDGRFKIHHWTGSYFGVASLGGFLYDSWASIGDNTLAYSTASPGPEGRTLDGEIAHEMDHVLANMAPGGDPHMDVTLNGSVSHQQTPNWLACR